MQKLSNCYYVHYFHFINCRLWFICWSALIKKFLIFLKCGFFSMAVLIKANRVERYFTCMVQGILWLVAHPCFFISLMHQQLSISRKKCWFIWVFFLYSFLSHHWLFNIDKTHKKLCFTYSNLGSTTNWLNNLKLIFWVKSRG